MKLTNGVEIKTGDDVEAEIERRAGVSLHAAPRGAQFVCLNPQTGGPLAVIVGEVNPFNKESLVVAIYQNDHVIRAYTVPKADTKDPQPPSRYTFTRNAPSYAVERMSLDVFIDELADELSEAADDMSPADRERELIADYVEEMLTNPNVDMLQDLPDLIRAGKHLEEADETPEEEEPDAEGAPTTPPPPPPDPS